MTKQEEIFVFVETILGGRENSRFFTVLKVLRLCIKMENSAMD